MVETIITLADAQIHCGVVSVFTVDEEGYAALVPLKEDNTPAKADIIIVGCEFDEDDECSFYELEDEEEYQKASKAFLMITEEYKEG